MNVDCDSQGSPHIRSRHAAEARKFSEPFRFDPGVVDQESLVRGGCMFRGNGLRAVHFGIGTRVLGFGFLSTQNLIWGFLQIALLFTWKEPTCSFMLA